MSQQINLFDPRFRKRKPVPSAALLVQCVGLALLAAGAVYYYYRHQVDGVTEELRAGQVLLKAERSYADRLKGESATKKKDTRLDAEIARLEAEFKQSKENMEALRSGVLGDQQGFAEYLRAFARRAVNGLWLTGFTIAGSGGEITIRGRVLAAELLPAYIQRLNQEKIFRGRVFSTLEMHQPRPEAVEPKAKDDKKKAAAPRFLEFSLYSTSPDERVAAGAAGATVAARREARP